VALVKRFDMEFPNRFADEIYRYLSVERDIYPIASKMFDEPIMSQQYFDLLANKFRSPHLWCYENGEWHLRHTVYSEA
jgi:hypothetical protein